MPVKVSVENLEDVPEAIRGDYKETTDPKTKATVYVLDLEGEVSVLPAVRTLKDEAARRRQNETALTAKLQKFSVLGDRDPTEIMTTLDRVPELEAAAEGKLDEAKINTIVEGRVKAKLNPIERQLQQAQADLSERDKKIGDLTGREVRRKITDEVSAAARAMKMLDSAIEDAIVLGERSLEVTEDGNVVTKDGSAVPGLTVKDWLADLQAKRPHWWGPSSGGGATGSRGGAGVVNPWSAENWNVTEQSAIYRTDAKRATTLAQAAGTSIGGRKPAAKK